MSRVLGIDSREDRVRAVTLRVAYRKLELEAFSEELVAEHESVTAALKACVARLGGLEGHRVDAVVTSLEGQRTFVHQLALPAAAQRRLEELLPFELEAQLPVDIDAVVYTHELLPRPRASKEPLQVLTISARTEHVRAKIEQLEEAIGRGPDRVGAAPIELGQLAHIHPELRSGSRVLLDLGAASSDLCLLEAGSVRGARSLSLGANAFPGRAQSLLAQLRQTLSGFRVVTGQPVEVLVLTGEGAQLDGITEYLSESLGVRVEVLGIPQLLGVTAEWLRVLPAFSRALAAGLHAARGKGFDLRRGPLAYQRGYSYLKERAPLLGGMAAAVIISFLFSTWAQGRALDNEQELLAKNLEQLTKTTFGEAVSDPDEATALLEQARRNKPEDPMPYLDGFGAAVALSETLPVQIRHDAEEFDYTRGKLKLRGIVDSTEDVQQLAKALDEHRCIENASVTKISQVVNSERERYSLEADVRCPEDPGDPKKKTSSAPSQPATEGAKP